MGIKIKNLQTGEFEKFNIPALKGEKGEPGEVEPSEKVDYIGKQHSKLRDTMNANVDYIIKTAIGEFNYLDYEGQHITATNSIEGHAKSAILKGQTLVNIVNGVNLGTGTTEENNSYILTQTNTVEELRILIESDLIELNKDYTFIYYIEEKTATNNGSLVVKRPSYFAPATNFVVSQNIGWNKIKFNVSSFGSNKSLTLAISTAEKEGAYFKFAKDKFALLSGDWTQKELPFDTINYGMQSVKMPVLTTTGKNLLNKENIVSGVFNSGTLAVLQSNKRLTIDKNNAIKVKPNTTYTLSYTTGYKVGVMELNATKTAITVDSKWQVKPTGHTFTTNANTYYVSFNISKTDDSVIALSDKDTLNLMFEQGSITTTYEPYKSNILSTPEEVVLRSLPSGVKDTLNLMTGEYVQRIGEIVLNGSETWVADNVGLNARNNFSAYTTIADKEDGQNIYGSIDNSTLNNKLCNGAYDYLTGSRGDNEGSNGTVQKRYLISIAKTKLVTQDLAGFKAWLQANPVTVQYELATPVIKTVDLSDNVVYSYGSITHYSCSSEEGSLVPTLSVKVPTDTQLTIQEQKATTQTLLIKNMDLQQSIKEVQAMNLAFNTALYNSFNSIREEVEDIKKHVSTNENLEGSF